MKRILIALTLSTVLASPAWSGSWIANKQQWDDLNFAQQVGYAMGAFDQQHMVYDNDPKRLQEMRQARRVCVANAELNPHDLVELINTSYKNDVSTWNLPPNLVLLQSVIKMCSSP